MSAPYLLLLDMNGTLCYRTEVSVPGVKADLWIRKKYYYRRIGLESMLEALHESQKFVIAAYSSMMSHNIADGLAAMLSAKHRRMITHVFDRKYNTPDPYGENEWDTVRSMPLVWKAVPDFNARNTLLLDNEARKFRDHQRNGIVVREFGPAELKRKDGTTLEDLTEYLLEMAEAEPFDVRIYMEDNPPPPSSGPRLPRVRPKAASAPSAAGDQLSQQLGGVSLRGSSSPPDAGASHQPVEAAHGEQQFDAVELSSVPAGTSVRLECIEDGEVVMENGGMGLRVELPVGSYRTGGYRVDHKIDIHRLKEECPGMKVWREHGWRPRERAAEPSLAGATTG